MVEWWHVTAYFDLKMAGNCSKEEYKNRQEFVLIKTNLFTEIFD